MQGMTHPIPKGVWEPVVNSFVEAKILNASQSYIERENYSPTIVAEAALQHRVISAGISTGERIDFRKYDFSTEYLGYFVGLECQFHRHQIDFEKNVRLAWKMVFDLSMDRHHALSSNEFTRGIGTVTAENIRSQNWPADFDWDEACTLVPSLWQAISASREAEIRVASENLEQLYSFRNRTAVIQFIQEHSSLVSLLGEIPGKLQNYFPKEPLFLEVIADPEAVNNAQLVVFVSTCLGPDEAMERLERFDNDWWLDALDRADGKLGVTLAFR